MKKAVLFVVCLLVASDALAGNGFSAAKERGVQDQYVVVLEEHVARRPGESHPGQPDVPEAAEFLTRMFGGQVEQSWEHVLQGFLVRMPEKAAQALARHPWVASVTQDVWVDPEEVLGAAVDDCYAPSYDPMATGYWVNPRVLPWFSPVTNFNCIDPDPQTSSSCIDNWGIDRIDQASVSRNQRFNFTDRGTDVHVYVLDTGIRADHREFQNRFGQTRVVGGINYAGGSQSDTSDCYGHGTHVAAIIGGRTYGVAKDVFLHPVRVILCPGSSPPASNWISGLNWIAANHNPATEGTAVVNWSGGNYSPWISSPVYADLQTAVRNLAAVPTLLLVQAAGNQSGNNGSYTQRNACDWSFGDESDFVSNPPVYDAVRRIFIAGGSDEDDGRWTRRAGDPFFQQFCTSGGDCGSNIGSCVDLFAPAAHVVAASYRHSGGYCRLSGTSMAAPHVAGVAANYLQRNRLKTAQQVKDRLLLESTANVLQPVTTHTNYIGAGSPNKLLDSRMPAVTCGVDRTLTTQKNVSVQFLASTLKGTGCLASDFVYSKSDTQFGSITIGGIGPSDILYYYNPPANWTGTDTFHYNVSDGSTGKIKAVGMVKVTVTP